MHDIFCTTYFACAAWHGQVSIARHILHARHAMFSITRHILHVLHVLFVNAPHVLHVLHVMFSRARDLRVITYSLSVCENCTKPQHVRATFYRGIRASGLVDVGFSSMVGFSGMFSEPVLSHPKCLNLSSELTRASTRTSALVFVQPPPLQFKRTPVMGF